MKTIQEKITTGTIIGVWIAAALFYGNMPERMASHWNAQGVANGYSGRFIGLFLVPVIMVVIQAVFTVIPRIDPLKENIKTFKKQFDGFALLMALFMAYLFGIIVAWNKGIQFQMNSAIAPAFGILFYGIGSMMKGVKRNWFIGIRTPWTMSSDEVWNKTHTVGSKVFKGIGILALVGMLFPHYTIAFMLIPALVGSFGIVGYSYKVFKDKK